MPKAAPPNKDETPSGHRPNTRSAKVTRGSSGQVGGGRKSRSHDGFLSPIQQMGGLNNNEVVEDETAAETAAQVLLGLSCSNQERRDPQENQNQNKNDDVVGSEGTGDEDEEDLFGAESKEDDEEERGEDNEDDDDDSDDDDNELASKFGSTLSAREEEGDDGAADESSRRRQSSRIKKNEENKKKANKKKAKKAKNTRKDAIKMGKWTFYHQYSAEPLPKQCLYVVKLPNGDYKFGYTYTEGDHKNRDLGDRINELLAAHPTGVWVRFIDTAGVLSADGVRDMERLVKFAAFALPTTEDGVLKSCYSGKGEIYKFSDRTLCDKIMEKLLVFAKEGKFSLEIGHGHLPITEKSIQRGTKNEHKKYIHYIRKTKKGSHKSRDCEWTGRDQEGSNDYHDKWIEFARSPTATCVCFTKKKRKNSK